ncbi:MAG TPA: ThuA domain-containing protein [Humisphaera sp.]
MLTRREFLIRSGAVAAAVALSRFPTAWAADDAGATVAAPKRKLLFFTKSSGFEHSAIRRKTPDELSHAEKVVTELGTKHNFDVTCTKDGTIFTPDKLAAFDAFMFYTTGDLTERGTDKKPPMTPEGKQAFLDLIAQGKGFVGTHSAADTFHSPGNKGHGPARFVQDGDKADPYVKMLGAEFIVHGAQGKAKMRAVDKAFPGMAPAGDGFEMAEEWYTFKNQSKDLHVLLAQEPGLKGAMYERPAYPATWARAHEKGRVFYTSMGHREEVWLNPTFQSILLGGLAWAFGNVKADVTPNVAQATPEYMTLGKEEPPKPAKK